MATAKSTRAPRPRKARPGKPRPDFPLFPHRSGQWAKKVKGRLVYFGVWDDPDTALNRWLAQKDDLLAGRKPRPHTEDGLTVAHACNCFLTSKEAKLNCGALSQRHFDDLHQTCKMVVKHFGQGRITEDLRPDDFREFRSRLAGRYGPAGLKRYIVNVRSIFRYAYENDLIDRPVKFGSEFATPTKKEFLKAAAELGERLFEPDQIRTMLDAATTPMRAIILLAVNCGLGNTDIAFLEEKHVDLDRGWLTYPRRKTGQPRRSKLWPKTVTAIRTALGNRPAHKAPEHAGRIFITHRGGPWGFEDKADSVVSNEFRKLAQSLELYRRGLSFYTLRHTYRTIADNVKDEPAVDLTMGHSRGDMASVYRQRIDDQRLEAVAQYVHGWLFGEEGVR